MFQLKSMSVFAYSQTTIPNNPVFPQVTELQLDFFEDWPLFSLQSLFIFIDISRIVHMTLYAYYFNKFDQNTWMDMHIFTEQAHHLSSLIIQDLSHASYKSDSTSMNFYSLLPRSIKHLHLIIDNVQQIEMIFERCPSLSTIKLVIGTPKLQRQVFSWFKDNTTHSTCYAGYRTVFVWLGKQNIQSMIPVNH